MKKYGTDVPAKAGRAQSHAEDTLAKDISAARLRQAMEKEVRRQRRNAELRFKRVSDRFAAMAQNLERGKEEASNAEVSTPAPAALPRPVKPKPIIYDHFPVNRADRRRRLAQQRAAAAAKNLSWDRLTEPEKEKRILFGQQAWCRTPNGVRALSKICAQIAHDREMDEIHTWNLTADEQTILKTLVGFLPPDALVASNKLVRVKMAYRLARILARLFRKWSAKHFYFFTIIHEGWHTRHNVTEIDLYDIKTRVRNVMNGHGFDWFGLIEIDICNNYPLDGEGLWIMPQTHFFAWRNRPIKPVLYANSMSETKRLKSALGAKTVHIQRVATAEDIAHLCFYITKPNYQCKSLGRANPETGKRKMFSPEKNIRPAYTLRIAEILSHLNVKDLMLASGEGLAIKQRLLDSLRRWLANLTNKRPVPSNIGGAWDRTVGRRYRASRQTPTFRRDRKP